MSHAVRHQQLGAWGARQLWGRWSSAYSLHLAADGRESLRGFCHLSRTTQLGSPRATGRVLVMYWSSVSGGGYILDHWSDSEVCQNPEWNWQGKERQFSGRNFTWKIEARAGCGESWISGWKACSVSRRQWEPLTVLQDENAIVRSGSMISIFKLLYLSSDSILALEYALEEEGLRVKQAHIM